MLKSEHEVLKDIKALHLSSLVMNQSSDFDNGFSFALLLIAQLWGVESDFIADIKQLNCEHFILIDKENEKCKS